MAGAGGGGSGRDGLLVGQYPGSCGRHRGAHQPDRWETLGCHGAEALFDGGALLEHPLRPLDVPLLHKEARGAARAHPARHLHHLQQHRDALRLSGGPGERPGAQQGDEQDGRRGGLRHRDHTPTRDAHPAAQQEKGGGLPGALRAGRCAPALLGALCAGDPAEGAAQGLEGGAAAARTRT